MGEYPKAACTPRDERLRWAVVVVAAASLSDTALATCQTAARVMEGAPRSDSLRACILSICLRARGDELEIHDLNGALLKRASLPSRVMTIAPQGEMFLLACERMVFAVSAATRHEGGAGGLCGRCPAKRHAWRGTGDRRLTRPFPRL